MHDERTHSLDDVSRIGMHQKPKQQNNSDPWNCGRPRKIEYATHEGMHRRIFPLDTQLLYRCKEGYEPLNGLPIAHCVLVDGIGTTMWVGPKLSCKRESIMLKMI